MIPSRCTLVCVVSFTLAVSLIGCCLLLSTCSLFMPFWSRQNSKKRKKDTTKTDWLPMQTHLHTHSRNSRSVWKMVSIYFFGVLLFLEFVFAFPFFCSMAGYSMALRFGFLVGVRFCCVACFSDHDDDWFVFLFIF